MTQADEEAARLAAAHANEEARLAKVQADEEAARLAKAQADEEAARFVKAQADEEPARLAKVKADEEAALLAKAQADKEARLAKAQADEEAALLAKAQANEAARLVKTQADEEAARLAKAQAVDETVRASVRDEEAALIARGQVDESFARALKGQPNGPNSGSSPTSAESDRDKMLYDIWAKAVETQMHFNEMATKSRQLGLTFVVSALGLAVFLLGKGEDWQLSFIPLADTTLSLSPIVWLLTISPIAMLLLWLLFPNHVNYLTTGRKSGSDRVSMPRAVVSACVVIGGFGLLCVLKWLEVVPGPWSLGLKGNSLNIHVSVVLVGGAVAALLLVRVLDLDVYHKMLRGAVAFGEDLEQQYLRPRLMTEPEDSRGLQKGMTEAISFVSRHKNAYFVSRADATENRPYGYHGTVQWTAHDKLRLFYFRAIALLVVVSLALFAYSNFSTSNAKELVAKNRVSQLVLEAYPAWLAARADKDKGQSCPRSLDDLIDHVRTKEVNDPWGHRYIVLCGHSLPKNVRGPLAIVSPGADGKHPSSDDVTSWP